MAQETNLPLVNPKDNFDQRVQDYFTNYFAITISMTDNEFEASPNGFLCTMNKKYRRRGSLNCGYYSSRKRIKYANTRYFKRI